MAEETFEFEPALGEPSPASPDPKPEAHAALGDAFDPTVSDEERAAFGVALAGQGSVPDPDDPVQRLVRAVANRVASERRVVEAARAWSAARSGSLPFPIPDEEMRRIKDELAGAINALDDHADEESTDAA